MREFILKITKAIIPVAGKGTRMLPATKAISKELIPILTMPMIHFVLQEALKAGITQIVFITSFGKEDIIRFYSRHLELETFLEKNNKTQELSLVKQIGEMIDVISVSQKEQMGLGHAILQAEKVIGNENFAILLGDEIIHSEKSVITQLSEVSAAQDGAPVIAVMEVPKAQTQRYGIVAGQYVDEKQKTLRMSAMVEKPSPEKAPTNLATPGRYVFTPEIFDYLRKIGRGTGGEYQLTDAIHLMAQDRPVYAHKYEGERFDTGSVIGYFEATVDFALRDPLLRDEASQIMKKRLLRHGY